jgi:membrane-bound lytic murein transglycosylase D
VKKILFILLLVYSTFSTAQKVEVPEIIKFADMKLHLSHGARKIIKTDIEAITRNEKYFLLKIDRANLYFPIIEKALKSEEFPEDFKFLALQESSLVSDAVSSSNAVGYWQFKKESAEEVGLRIDYEVDERMNIVSSTKGAAKYLRKSYNVLNNWVYTLLAYNLGLGGVKPHVKQKYIGAAEMQIDENMHWYVMRFLAHKLAYENAVGKYPHPNLTLVEYPNGARKSLKHIAEEKNIPKEEVEDYNKWALKGRVPDDKDYIVILPIKQPGSETVVAKDEVAKVKIKKEGDETKIKIKRKGKRNNSTEQADASLIIEHNKLKAIRAKEGDSFAKLAASGGITLEEFFTHNDLGVFEEPVEGTIYYLEPKRSHALVEFHTVSSSESLNEISQKYGIRVNSIRKKNRMGLNENPQVGRVLWLKKKRPRKTAIEIKSGTKNTKEENSTPQESEPVEKASPPAENVPQKNKHKKEERSSTSSNKKENVSESSSEPPVISEPITEDKTKDEVKVSPELREAKAEPIVVIVEESKIENIDTGSMKEVQNLPAKETHISKPVDPIAKESSTIKENTQVTSPSGSVSDQSVIYHTVEKGQTLYFISRTYDVKIDSLLAWNNLPDKGLKLGQVVTIKKAIEKKINVTQKEVTHIVEKGQTIYSISRIYRVEPMDILNWNNKKDYNVSIGETLIIHFK